MRTSMPSIGRLTPKQEAALDPEVRAKGQADYEARMEHVSEPGFLKHERLDALRQEFGIVDESFSFQPFDDKIVAYQVSRTTGDTYAGGNIVMTPSRQRAENENNPVAILLAAGPKGLDALRMNGMDLGDMVTFLELSPWRYQTKCILGDWEEVLMLRVGNIVGDFDLTSRLRSGECTLKFDEKNYEHYYEDASGALWYPQKANPFISEDY
jgi:hypothetical protein